MGAMTAATSRTARRIATAIGGKCDGSRNHGKGKRPAEQFGHENSPL
jgi:hypothetical protein